VYSYVFIDRPQNLAMNDAYSADVEKVIRVQFSLMSPEDIRRRSVVEITKERIYDGGGIPCAGGLADRKMGVLESGIVCSTDDLDKQECPGYFGHIELAMPVFYVQFVPWIRGVLESVCYRCGALRVNRELRKKPLADIAGSASNATRYTKLTKLIKADKTGSSMCPACNARQPDKYIYEKEDLQIIAEWTRSVNADSAAAAGSMGGPAGSNPKSGKQSSRVLMTPEYVHMLFKRLPDEDCLLLGFDPQYSRPEWMICTVLPVAPPCVRPSVKKEGQQPRSEDDLTHKYIDIIKCNRMLKQKLHSLAQQQHAALHGNGAGALSGNGSGGGTSVDEQIQINSRMVESWRYILQYHIATLIDNDCGVNQAQQRSGRPLKAIRQRLKSKEGRIRGNLMGKRVDFSARTVITPDPLLKLDELGVPMDMCINMTVPERVNPFNMERLRKMVANGVDKYPGARIIEKANGKRLTLKFFTGSDNRHLLEEKALGLRIGDVVHRHLLEGDPVLFNRQPSLHKMSMMCHRVKPMDIGKTFRLSVDATTPYNADFDGDEMNMHVPQSVEAATELQSLAAVHLQLIGPALAKPVISPVQDTMLGAYLMSRAGSGRVFGRREFMNAMLWTSRTWTKLVQTGKTPQSEDVTGLDACTAIMPDGLNIDLKDKLDDGSANHVVVRDGHFISGTLRKRVFTQASQGLIHVAFQDCGATAARDLIDDVRGIVTAYMYNRGFSVGLSDLVVSDKIKDEIKSVIVDVHKQFEEEMQQLYEGTLQNATCLTKAEFVESMAQGKAFNIANRVGKQILTVESCRFKDMITSKSKGNVINIAQMMGCLGQQSIEGKRASYSFQDRTLPHFSKFDDSLEARGFVDNSYLNGLTPHEFFFHAMGGRVGLIDTAVKTAQTGYIQRRLVKSMEDLRCENDRTVRSASGRIVHMLFGEDGMDSSKLEKQRVLFACREHTLVRDYLGDHASSRDKEAFVRNFYAPADQRDLELLAHQGLKLPSEAIREPDIFSGLPVVTYFRKNVCGGSYTGLDATGKTSTRDTVMYPVHLERILKAMLPPEHNGSEAKSSKKGGRASPAASLSFADAMSAIDRLTDDIRFACDPANPTLSINPANQMFRVLLYGTLLRVETRQRISQMKGDDGLARILSEVKRRFETAQVHAGEMVGVVAAQSIGEPATQMTLNTFHLAGVGSKSKVNQGVPRLNEILKLSKNPKTSELQMFLKPEFRTETDANSIKNTLEITTLRDVTKSTSVYYDPAADRFGTTLKEDAQVLQYLDALQQDLFGSDSSLSSGGESDMEDDGDGGDGRDESAASTTSEVSHEQPHPSTETNLWVVRIEMDREQMFARDLRMEDVYLAMKALHGDDIEVEYSDDNAENLLIRVRVSSYQDNTEQMDDFYLLKMLETNLLDNVVLRGVPLINNARVEQLTTGSCFVKKGGGHGKSTEYTYEHTSEHVIFAEGTKSGTNLQEILTHPAIDATRTLSDHITEVHEVLGIEAARELILRELTKVISSSSDDCPSRRHMMLLADTMTAQGSVLISIDRNGIKRSDVGPLAKCSFEESEKQLYQAAIFGQSDEVDGVSANIMLGQVPPCGTGMVRVIFDESEFMRMQKSFKSKNPKIKSWKDHVRKWEEDLEHMHEVQMDLHQMEESGVLPTIDEDDLAMDHDDAASENSMDDEDMLLGITNEADMMDCDTTVVFGGGISLDD
jgi:DNA-directed RNA polymerase II subunit RPB1